jgi:hypothetical protein
MAYGFKFYNNYDQVVIDDNNVKPWYIADAYIGRNYLNTNVTTIEFLYITTSGNIPSNNITGNTNETWQVYEVKYVAPNNADCFAMFTLPDSGSTGIWYTSASSPVTTPNIDASGIYIDGVYIGYYPTFSIYAMVPQSWLNTNPSAAQIAAVVPKVYYYAANAIPNGSLGRGWGVQVFNESGKATYDSGKYHVQINNNSFPSPQIPNPPGTYGPEYNGSRIIDTPIYAPGNSLDTTAFLIPKVSQKLFGTNGFGYSKYVLTTKIMFQRVSSTLKTRNINVLVENYSSVTDWNNVASGTYFNYGLRTIRDTNWYIDNFYADLFAVDAAGLDRGYSSVNFPGGYSLTGNATGAYEYISVGQTPDYSGVITLTTFNVPNGTVVPYTITGTGITTSDFSAMYMDYNTVSISLTGSFTVNANSSRFSFNLTGDTILEGTETLTLTLNNGLASITFQIKEQKTYALSWVGLSSEQYKFDEGTTATARLTTNNVPNGTQVAYALIPYYGNTQPNSADFNNATLTGNFTVNTGGATNSNGTADINFVITADNLLEGAEGFLLTLPVIDPGLSLALAGEITDTSKPAPTYTIKNPSGGISGDVYLDEGTSYTFTVETTGITSGTIVYPVVVAPLTADASTDISASWYNPSTGVNSGVAVNSSGIASFTFTVVADYRTEGLEYFTLALNNAAGTRLTTYPNNIYINDTSQEPVEVYSITPATQTVNEGTQISFSMVAADDYGHDVFWTIEGTGIDLNDISSMRYFNPSWADNGLPRFQSIAKSLQGTFIFPDTLDKTLQVTLANDTTTEGTETMTFKLRQSSYTSTPRATSVITINDTSRGAVNETITLVSDKVVFPNGINVTWSGGYANDTVQYSVDNEDYDQVFYLNANGYANNPNAAVNYGIGQHTAYFYYQGSQHYRSFTWTVMPDYSIIPTVTSVDEGGTVTWNVTAPVPNGTYLYWTNTGSTNSLDFDDYHGNTNQSTVLINGYNGWFYRTLKNDVSTGEGAETIIMNLWKDGYNSNFLKTATTVTVNDTSSFVASNDNNLSALSLSSGTLDPSFTPSTINYTASVTNATSSITVTATVNQANATLTVNNTATTSGTGRSINLNVGSNSFTVVVTAQNGEIKIYYITVTRAAATPTYAVSANTTSINETTSPTVTYTVTTTNVANGTVIYWINYGNARGGDWTSYTDSGSVTINNDTATFNRTARADATTEPNAEYDWIFLYTDSNYNNWTGAYAAQVYITDTSQTVALSTDSSLSNLTVSPGTLSPGFSSTTTNYTVSVTNATTQVAITPTVNQANATVTVGGYDTTTGTARNFGLNVGDNAFNIIVTAQNGSTTTYTLTVTRAAAVTYNETVTVSPTSWLTTGSTTVTLSGAQPYSSFNYGINDPNTGTFGDYFNANGYWQNTNAFAGSPAGTYTLYVKFNATGTVRSVSGLTVSAPATLSVSNYSISATGVPNSMYYYATPSPNATYDGIRINAFNTYDFDYSVTRQFYVSAACTITCYLTVSTEYNYDYGYIFVDDIAMYENTWPAVNNGTTAGNGVGIGGATGLVPAHGLSGSYSTNRVGESGYVASGPMTRALSAGWHTVKVRYMADYSLPGTYGLVLGEYSLA